MRCVAVVLCLLWAPHAWASFDAPPVYRCYASGSSQSYYGDSPEAACLSAAAAALATNWVLLGTANCDGVSKCTMPTHNTSTGVDSYILRYYQASGYACPANSTGTTSCTCNAGYDEQGSTCVQHQCPSAGTALGGDGTMVGISGGAARTSFCTGGCEASARMSAVDAQGNAWVWGPFTSTGVACSMGAAGSAQSAPATQCAKGTCPGTVNGASVCVACSSTTTTSEGSSTTTSTSTSASGVSSSTGSSGSTSSSTTCANGSCTTSSTTTTTNSDGSTSSTTATDTKDQASFCKDNPGSAQCVSSSWGGSCSGGYSCDGDAVQCAQAQASWKAACATEVDPSNAYYQDGVAGLGAGDTPGDHPRNSASVVDVSLSSRISDTPLFGVSGDCIADKTLSLHGFSLTLPWSTWCPYLQWMGYAFLSTCYLAALWIVFGGRTS